MKTTLRTAAVLPFLASWTLAQSSSPLTCRTSLGTKSLQSVPTTTVTSTQAQSTETLAFQSTVTRYVPTLSVSTRTTTQTDFTTDNAVTDVFTTTTTVYNVNTITTPTTTTTTTTLTSTTSSTSTTEMATTAGWQPISDTLNSYAFPKKRALEHPHAARALTSGKVGLQAVLATSTYLAGVTCKPVMLKLETTWKGMPADQVALGTALVANPKVKTVYTTLRPSTSTVYYAYATAYTTHTIQSTSTIVPPDVSTTQMSTYISQVTTTTSTLLTETDTASTTTTSIIPGPTVWDACASYNIFGPNFNARGNEYHVANVANNGPGVASNFNILADGASSALDCCNSCQSLGSCETFIFRARNENCFLLTHAGETCANQLNHPNYFLSISGADTGAGYVVGNGNCGFTYSGNSDGSVWAVDSGSGFNEN